jgi:hypothetical protein
MSDFDALKWLSLCDQWKTARRRRRDLLAVCDVPATLLSVYGVGASFISDESENTSGTMIELAA